MFSVGFSVTGGGVGGVGGVGGLVHLPAHGLHTNGPQQSLSSEHCDKLQLIISHWNLDETPAWIKYRCKC